MTSVARTSQSDPLRIAAVAAPGGGQVGVTFCPGKHQLDGLTGLWARDLEADLAVVRDWGAEALVTLVPDEELTALSVDGLGEAAERVGLAWAHLPIRDVSIPTDAWERLWAAERVRLHGVLDRGGRVVVHCKGGLGRAGTVAALLLVERGVPPNDAIRRVRAERPGAIETRWQAEYVGRARPSWSPSDV